MPYVYFICCFFERYRHKLHIYRRPRHNYIKKSFLFLCLRIYLLKILTGPNMFSLFCNN